MSRGKEVLDGHHGSPDALDRRARQLGRRPSPHCRARSRRRQRWLLLVTRNPATPHHRHAPSNGERAGPVCPRVVPNRVAASRFFGTPVVLDGSARSRVCFAGVITLAMSRVSGSLEIRMDHPHVRFPVRATVGRTVDVHWCQPLREHVVIGVWKGHAGPRFPFIDGAGNQ